AGHGRRFGGEVGVADYGLGRGGVLVGDAEVTDGGADGVLLEGAEAAAGGSDLLDRLGDDGLCGLEVTADDVEGLAAGDVVEVAHLGVAELADGDVADADGDLAGDVDRGGELEVSAAAGDGEGV